MVKNLKHGIKVTKRDVVLNTCYSVLFENTPCKFFTTKLEAINFLTDYLRINPTEKDRFTLFKVQSIKF